jgi:hypothetical protein
MRRHLPTLTLALALLVGASVTLRAEPMAAAGGHDIGELMALAEENYDLETMDAVILLDSETVLISPGARKTTVHEIVWIATERGIDTYADLRVPYDSATSSLEVVSLRTWMDGRWWPHDTELNPTAIVETIPYAAQSADDYTTMRETMLLHDGVEIPCIVETVYTIEERRPEDLGADGMWVFPRHDPVVRSRLVLALPNDTVLATGSANGAPEAASRPRGDAITARMWQMDLVDRIPRPLAHEPSVDAPHVVWSTWPSWQGLGDAFLEPFDEAAGLSDALVESVAVRTARAPTLRAKAEAIAAFVRESTRYVNYDVSHWRFEPRSATRVWETAYGHELDRAVLAAALFRKAGFRADPVYRTAPFVTVAEDVPGFAQFEDLRLWVNARGLGDDLSCYFDPSSGSLDFSTRPMSAREIWIVDDPEGPAHWPTAGPVAGEIDVVLTLEPDEEGGWTGTGYVGATHELCPYDAVSGIGGETGSYIGRLAGGILEGADVSDHSLAYLTEEKMSAGFAFTLSAGEDDETDRTEIVAGSVRGGVLANLFDGVTLHHGHRGSTVRAKGPLSQRLVLQIRTGDFEGVRFPAELTLENAVGSFTLTVDEDTVWTTVTRELVVDALTIPPEHWPLLRELLLAEESTRARTIVLE